jgi:glycosyltransferase involved in cell wall biosynthesis
VDATVSVVIPVKDAGDDLRRLLAALRDQQGLTDLEIVVVDSGSTDGSGDTAREFDATVISIAPEDFSHSGTRNLAAQRSRGTHLLFTVQDALPPSEFWLHDLLSLMKSEKVAAVSCAERPRADADLFYRVSLWFHNRFMEVDGRDRIMSKPDEESYLALRKNGQLSNIACLMPKALFLQYGFRGDFGEDLDLGVRLIKDGYKLALLGTARVLHSHNRPAYYHLKRGYVDALLLSQMFRDFPVHAVDADDLLRSIGPAFDVLDALVHRDLRQLALPCATPAVSRMVLDSLQAAGATTVAYIERPHPCVQDTNLQSFLQRRCGRSQGEGSPNPANPVVLGAVRGALAGVFEYMMNTADVVDGPALQDFIACLYKTCAIQCGSLLGSTFGRGSVETRLRLRDINAELIRGV